jgi:hypothetical protein
VLQTKRIAQEKEIPVNRNKRNAKKGSKGNPKDDRCPTTLESRIKRRRMQEECPQGIRSEV